MELLFLLLGLHFVARAVQTLNQAIAGRPIGRIAGDRLRSGSAVSVSARPSLRLRPLACATGSAAVRSGLLARMPDGELVTVGGSVARPAAASGRVEGWRGIP
jgi:hypothetical protein